MAIVVIEEMLGGLDEVKEALDQAITVLTDLVEECDPAMVPHLPDVLERTLLQPLTAHGSVTDSCAITPWRKGAHASRAIARKALVGKHRTNHTDIQ